eukprot:CAMPEP_0177368802 /NCGR_PEP_ID=MMETSP0368-20130122/41123_1 /TAXON_ID=447022 ORGANISM="Scrippsiella hangoei-like, Strain SHHI-4" /NCGR_SAMPLE_ID=MMETSP0368 /ASSEMBLY_ACC=CAM_ASM_000363 /LENGTH=37 /DNA_ID= /DNA_START= /DNA_END= /DNA_ORIENTATION=
MQMRGVALCGVLEDDDVKDCHTASIGRHARACVFEKK